MLFVLLPPNITHNDSPTYISLMPSCASTVQQKVSLSQCNRTHQSGIHYLRDASSKGHTKSQTDHPGTHCSGIQHPVIVKSMRTLINAFSPWRKMYCATILLCLLASSLASSSARLYTSPTSRINTYGRLSPNRPQKRKSSLTFKRTLTNQKSGQFHGTTVEAIL